MAQQIIGGIVFLAIMLCGLCYAKCPWGPGPLTFDENTQAGYMVYNFSENEIVSSPSFDDSLNIQSGNEKGIFEIQDGCLYLNKTLALDGPDNKEMCAFMQNNNMAFNLKLQCKGNPTPNAPQSIIIVESTDDFSPEIIIDPDYSLNITERSNPASANLELSGIHKHDKDCGTGNLQFELRDIYGLDNAYFSISGDVLSANAQLDYEKNQSYRLNVSLISNLLSGRGVSKRSLAEVEIRVLDVDDQSPVFGEDEYHVTFVEEQDPGTATWVQTSPPLHATDGDTGINATILYSIARTEPLLNITIDPVTGGLKLLETLDREKIASYRVMVRAYQEDDPLMKVTTTLTVHVSDVNDHRPTFTPDVINVTVREDAIAMQIVALVSATDKDAGVNGKLAYRITPGSVGNAAFELATEPSGITALVVKRSGFLRGQSVIQVEIEAVEGSLPAVGSDACSACILTVNVHVISGNASDHESPDSSSYIILPVSRLELMSDVAGLERKLRDILGATVSVEGIDPLRNVPQLGSSVSITSQILSTADLDNLITNHAPALYTAFAPFRSPTSQESNALETPLAIGLLCAAGLLLLICLGLVITVHRNRKRSKIDRRISQNLVKDTSIYDRTPDSQKRPILKDDGIGNHRNDSSGSLEGFVNSGFTHEERDTVISRNVDDVTSVGFSTEAEVLDTYEVITEDPDITNGVDSKPKFKSVIHVNATPTFTPVASGSLVASLDIDSDDDEGIYSVADVERKNSQTDSGHGPSVRDVNEEEADSPSPPNPRLATSDNVYNNDQHREKTLDNTYISNQEIEAVVEKEPIYAIPQKQSSVRSSGGPGEGASIRRQMSEPPEVPPPPPALPLPPADVTSPPSKVQLAFLDELLSRLPVTPAVGDDVTEDKTAPENPPENDEVFDAGDRKDSLPDEPEPDYAKKVRFSAEEEGAVRNGRQEDTGELEDPQPLPAPVSEVNGISLGDADIEVTAM